MNKKIGTIMSILPKDYEQRIPESVKELDCIAYKYIDKDKNITFAFDVTKKGKHGLFLLNKNGLKNVMDFKYDKIINVKEVCNCFNYLGGFDDLDVWDLNGFCDKYSFAGYLSEYKDYDFLDYNSHCTSISKIWKNIARSDDPDLGELYYNEVWKEILKQVSKLKKQEKERLKDKKEIRIVGYDSECFNIENILRLKDHIDPDLNFGICIDNYWNKRAYFIDTKLPLKRVFNYMKADYFHINEDVKHFSEFKPDYHWVEPELPGMD